MSLFKSVTKLIGGVAKIALPAAQGIATVYGGPVAGQITGSLVNAYMGGNAPSMPGVGTDAGVTGTVGSGGGMMPVGAQGSWGSAASKWLISAKGIVSTVTGRLLGVMQGSKLLRLPAIANLMKYAGPAGTAAALGLTVVEVAQLVAAHFQQTHSRRKRGRGITGRDVRTTRRTIHKIRSIEHSLSGVCRPRAPSRARARAPAAFIRQG